MKYKLIDYTTNEKENVTFGTCEICMRTGSMTEQIFHIQDVHGVVHEVEGYAWDWGDLNEISISNIPHFAAWLEKQDIEPPHDSSYGYDYGWLNSIVGDYYEYVYLHDVIIPWIEKNIDVDGNKMIIQVDNKTYSMFNSFDFREVLYHVNNLKGLDVNYDSFKPSGSNIFEFGENTQSADFSLRIDYFKQQVKVVINEYDKYGDRENYSNVYLGDIPGKITIQFKDDDTFPDFSYQQQ